MEESNADERSSQMNASKQAADKSYLCEHVEQLEDALKLQSLAEPGNSKTDILIANDTGYIESLVENLAVSDDRSSQAADGKDIFEADIAADPPPNIGLESRNLKARPSSNHAYDTDLNMASDSNHKNEIALDAALLIKSDDSTPSSPSPSEPDLALSKAERKDLFAQMESLNADELISTFLFDGQQTYSAISLFDFDLWARIFMKLDQRSMKSISYTLKKFHRVANDVRFRAKYYIKSESKVLVLFQLAMKNLLSIELVYELLELGAHLPKYLVEKLFQAQESSGIPNNALVALLPSAYKLYPDLSLIGALDKMEDSMEGPLSDDFFDFESCFAASKSDIDVERLRVIVMEHHFTPALAPPHTTTGWSDLFQKIYRLFKSGPGERALALYLSTYSGAACPNELLLIEAFHYSGSNKNSIQLLADFGMLPSASVVQMLLTDSVRPINTYTHVMILLRDCIPATELREYAELALILLFQEADNIAVAALDYLINEFQFEENTISKALLSKDIDYNNETLITIFGQESTGMTEKLCYMMLSRYGADHVFTKACFSDLVIGSLIVHSTHDDDQSAAASVDYRMSRISYPTGGRSSYAASMDHHVKEMDDGRARDAMEILTDSGLGLDPCIVGRAARHIYASRKVDSRHIDFFSRIEKDLLRDDKTPTCTDLSNQDWIDLFKVMVLDDPRYIIQCHPERLNNAAKTDGNFVGSLQNVLSKEWNQVKRFYAALHQLVMELTDAKGNPLNSKFFALRSSYAGPFKKWLNELDTHNNSSTVTTGENSTLKTVSSMWNAASNAATNAASSSAASWSFWKK